MVNPVTATEEWIMPIDVTFGRQIIQGFKRYEIRSRQLHCPVGTRIWIYATKTSRNRESGDTSGAILGYMLFGGCREVRGPTDLREIAKAAASTYANLHKYVMSTKRREKWPVWGVEVYQYARLQALVEVTIKGQSMRRFDDGNLLRRLRGAEMSQPRYPLSDHALARRRQRRNR